MPDWLDPNAATVALLVFVVALLVAWALKRFEVTDSVGFIALIVLPMAAYGVASGYVAKISTPGGWAAEFREVATDLIRPARLTAEVEDLSIIEKAGIQAIQPALETLEIGKPIAISLRMGRAGYYSPTATAAYIRTFQPFDPNLTVLFLEEDSGRFVASTNGNSVLAVLSMDESAYQFLTALESADLIAMRRLVVLTTNSVDEDTTNAEALRMMVADGVDAMIKTDGTGQPVGLVRRDEIMSRLMVSLAEG